MNYGEITTKINRTVPEIRVRGLLRKRKETLEQFLIKFFESWNDEHETITVKDKSTQTDPGKRRSVGDIFKICQYYYPKCTLEEVTSILYEKLPEKLTGFRSSHCSIIKKRVFYRDANQQTKIVAENTPDEWGKTVREWLGKKAENVDDDHDEDDE